MPSRATGRLERVGTFDPHRTGRPFKPATLLMMESVLGKAITGVRVHEGTSAETAAPEAVGGLCSPSATTSSSERVRHKSEVRRFNDSPPHELWHNVEQRRGGQEPNPYRVWAQKRDALRRLSPSSTAQRRSPQTLWSVVGKEDDQGVAVDHEHMAPIAGQCWVDLGLTRQQGIRIAAGAVGVVAELDAAEISLGSLLPLLGSTEYLARP